MAAQQTDTRTTALIAGDYLQPGPLVCCDQEAGMSASRRQASTDSPELAEWGAQFRAVWFSGTGPVSMAPARFYKNGFLVYTILC
jgi:hypothetical protein